MSEVHARSGGAGHPEQPSVGFRKIARGAVWNWIAFVVTGGLGFFVSPYLVHRLGGTSYGVWILVNSIVAYMAILDLGIRGAVVRFVSADQPRGLHQEASKAVSAALWFRVWLCGLVLIGTVVLALVATRVFQIPPEMHQAARVAILLAGTNVVISLVFGVFGGVLNALHRFDLISVAGIGQAVLNAAGVIVLLGSGHGIAAIALWQLIVGVVSGGFLCKAAFRVYPELTLSWRPPGRELIQKFGSYSLYLFLYSAAGQVIYYTDNVIIGTVLPVSAVTLYALGFAPTQYLGQILSAISVALFPAASNLAAQGNYDELRRLLSHGTRAVMAIALSIEVALLIRGETFISLWMGPQYGEPSGRVLQILVIAWFFNAGNFCAANIVFALSKHKKVVIWTMFEAIANLALSLVLVRRWGVVGVAWGTTIPSLIMQAFVWPRYVTNLLAMPLGRYLVQCYVRPAIGIIPFAIACVLAERSWPAGNLALFFLQMAALLPLALAGVGLVFRRELTDFLRARNWIPRSQAA